MDSAGEAGGMSPTTRHFISNEVQKAVDASQNNLLTSMQTMMDANFTNFRQSIETTQKDLSTTQLAKIEESMFGSYKFKRHGNEAQYRGNIQVISKLREADTNLENQHITIDNVTSARDRIKEGIDLLNERQKLIKIADSSPLGWKVVTEYQANPIADNSDDEKKISKAQARAEKKAKESKKQRSRPHPYARQPYTTTPNRFGRSEEPVPVSRPGNCFKCGGKGHWVRECKKQSTDVKEISIDSFSLSDLKSDHSTILCKESVCSVLHSESINSNSPVGRLRHHLHKWVETGASSYCIEVIQSGYKLPFRNLPEGVSLKNNRSALDNPEFVIQEINELLQKGCVSEITLKPKIINPLTVAYNKKGKPRLVLDCRHINMHLFKFKYRYEDSEVARDIFEKGDFLFSYDLKSAYHHIPIYVDHRVYLGFSWNFGNKTRYFVYNVLPFGLSTAGFIFSKVTRHFVKHVRSMDIKLVMYLDDGLAGSCSYSEALRISELVKTELQSFGFLLAHDKCDWEPKQVAQWLGFQWNLEEGIIRVTSDRVHRVLSLLREILRQVGRGQVLFSAKLIASLVGQIISTKAVIGDEVRRSTRYLYFCIEGRASWNSKVKLSTEAIKEMTFWNENIDKLNAHGAHLKSFSLPDESDFQLFSDASNTGFGGFLIQTDSLYSQDIESAQQQGCDDRDQVHGSLISRGRDQVHGSWTSSESVKSSTWRELESVHRIIQTKSVELGNSNVKVISDNKNVCHILRVGSKTNELQNIANDIFESCKENRITIFPCWVPRNENQEADSLSRMSDRDDWGLSQSVFNTLEVRYGPHDYDRFACHYNNKCQRFSSKVWCPGTNGVNAFMHSWSGYNNLIVPPPSMAAEAINKCLGIQRGINAAVEQSGAANNIFMEDLAAKMSHFVVMCKSENTASTYFGHFKRWSAFIKGQGFQDIPAQPIHVALYITHLLDRGSSSHVINHAIYAIKWAHDLNGMADPTNNSYVRSLQEAAKRIATPKVVRKDPVSTELLISLCDLHANSNDLLIVRDLCMILFSFAGFLRFDELSNLKCCDVKLFEHYMSLQINRSKTDQYRQGNEILIAEGQTSACPMSMMSRYITLACLDLQSSDFLFKPIFRSKGISKLVYKNKKLSYTTARETIVSRLKSVNPNANFGLHSLRSGGATAAVAGDVNERCVKRHGRWKCDTSKDMYIIDQISSRLSVSQQLGL
ncbi:hypothetical protein FSP39_016878 [Pinctada imbricata]|uniref:CCHC-type domain-containing protein n=1 Tax=Pinctada imbricata TaxID=66713 RepID=A0AA89CB18_PINIB|nr:hypothetical protein FSP39_016878 [Pinctada imbricata]